MAVITHAFCRRLTMSACALAVLLTTAFSVHAQSVSTGNPLLDELVNNGVEAPNKQKVLLPAPTLTDGMSAQQQENALLPYAKPLGVDNFYDGGVRGRYSYKQSKQKNKLNDGSEVRTVDLYFVAIGDLGAIIKKDLLSDIIPKNNGGIAGIPEGSRELAAKELMKAGVTAGKQPDGSTMGFGTSQANLIDKVYLDIVTKSQTTESLDSIILATQIDPMIASQAGLPCTWQPIKRVAGVYQIVAPKTDYRGAAGYAKATTLKGMPDKILVEIHLIYVEPNGWFRGANFLNSKIGTVVDSAVPDFRRKLAEAKEDQQPAS